eukprot:6474279-Amphidinium_carterae.1
MHLDCDCLAVRVHFDMRNGCAYATHTLQLALCNCWYQQKKTHVTMDFSYSSWLGVSLLGPCALSLGSRLLPVPFVPRWIIQGMSGGHDRRYGPTLVVCVV